MINITSENRAACCGCTACKAACPKQCIEMKRDDEGFAYPVVSKTDCIDCGMCESVCPVIHSEQTRLLPERAFIIRSMDFCTVRRSTSGGAVTAIYRHAVTNGGVIYGAVFDDDFNVVHIRSDNPGDLWRFQSSKYVQSDLKDVFLGVKKDLSSGVRVVFVGTPCQVEGLLNFLKKPYPNLYTIDFICRGVPSPMVWERYRDFMAAKYKSVPVYASFRDKIYGYHSSSMSFEFENGKKTHETTKTDLYLKSFFDGVTVRPSCYECRFRKAKRRSDLTVFDCWDISRYDKSTKDDDYGYTGVFVQSEKGMQLIDEVRRFYIIYNADPLVLVKNDAHMALENPEKNSERDRYFELLNSGMSIDKVVKKTIPVKLGRKVFGKFRGVFYKTGILKLLKKLK